MLHNAILIAAALFGLALLFDVAMQSGSKTYRLTLASSDVGGGVVLTDMPTDSSVTLSKGEIASVLRLEFQNPQFVGHAYVELLLSGRVTFYQGQQSIQLESGAGYCREDGASLTCRVPVKLSDTPDWVLLSPTGDAATVKIIEVVSVAQHHIAWKTTVPILLLLLLFTPLAAGIGFIGSPALRRPLITALSLAFVAQLSPALLVFSAVLVVTSFVLLSCLTKGTLKLRNLVLALLLVVVTAKFIWPMLGSTFSADAMWVLLPIGLSYMVARHIDLGIKIAGGQVTMPSAAQFLTYSFYWPSYAAGPITEQNFFNDQNIYYPVWSERSEGLVRVASGFAKKMTADVIWFAVVQTKTTQVMIAQDGNPALIIMLCLGNMLFVYLDFSGYSDIAVGSARLMGIRIPENFNNPLMRSNLREFWLAWHMSLTRWVNRNVFMPLSLSVRREKKVFAYALPVIATTTTIGIWHGLQIVWLLWGLHHAVGIFLTDFALKRWGAMRARHRGLTSPAANVAAHALGVVFVWYWVMLSYSFTLTTNPSIAAGNYLRLLIAPVELAERLLF